MVVRWKSRQCRRSALVWMVMVVLVVACIKPLRNALLYPVWPSQWRTVGSYRLLDRHVRDFFYPMDRQPYTGSCQPVIQRVEELGLLRRADTLSRAFRLYTQADWDRAELRMRQRHDDDTMAKLRHFRPALTEEEQRALLRNLYVVTAALDAFNVSYMAAEGTLIGALRHGGLVPWDDDADVTFRADQWATAKRVLSCLPGFEMKIQSDFLWKFFSKDSPLWQGEAVTRFPYVDLFPYGEDEEYMWPLIVWLKNKMLWPRRHVFPTGLANFDNFRLRVPRDVPEVLGILFGAVSTTCESRLFERRERKLMADNEIVRVDCRLLKEAYPSIVVPDADQA